MSVSDPLRVSRLRYDADVMAASHTFWILLAGLTGSGILADLDQMSDASLPL